MSFVCDDHEFSCRINDEASICTAELLAIEAAIEYIWDSNDEEFMIVTDFKYNISVYLDDILQGEWNINVTSKLSEEMTLSYAGPELAMPISQTAIY